MNMFKRWTTSVCASFDWMVSQVENHEALVASALREMQQAGAKARAQLKQVQRDGQTMRKRLLELEELEAAWKERALRSRESDNDAAIECLRRRKLVKREHASLSEQIEAHKRFEKQLTMDLKTIEERVAELKRRKNTLTARQYRNDAMQAGSAEEIGLIAEIDEIFERWEIKLDEKESLTVSSFDVFETDFIDAEEEDALRAELLNLANE
ncbi:MAG: PspA/IM30 family protein [Bdellovibrionales bacterium]|nr:PspA/IM30 family protein [Bdellovibrionales bacterium]